MFFLKILFISVNDKNNKNKKNNKTGHPCSAPNVQSRRDCPVFCNTPHLTCKVAGIVRSFVSIKKQVRPKAHLLTNIDQLF